MSIPDQGTCATPGEGVRSQGQSVTHVTSAPDSYAVLRAVSDQLDQIESARIAAENRHRALMDDDRPRMLRHRLVAEEAVESLCRVERGCVLELEHAMRAHPLGPWVEGTIGVGLKQGARLLAATGDPSWNHAEGRERRGPAEFWAYCGYDPMQKRKKGQKSNWNPHAKMRAYLIAGSCIKSLGSPYRAVYDAERAKWAERETTDGHKHNHALRVVAKWVLRDLWRAAHGLAPRAISVPSPVDLPPGANERSTSAVEPPRAISHPAPIAIAPGMDREAVPA